MFISFLSFYAFSYYPGVSSTAAFVKGSIQEIILLASILYILLIYSRKRENIFLKAVTVFIVFVPLIFLSYQYRISSYYIKTETDTRKAFANEKSFYENSDYSLYISKSSNKTLREGILFSKKSSENPFQKITDTEIRIAGKNSFYVKLDNSEVLFSGKGEPPDLMKSLFEFITNFSETWEQKASENSILFLLRISIFILFIISLTTAVCISPYPIINFAFYSASVAAAISVITLSERTVLPYLLRSKLPESAHENWGYILIFILSCLLAGNRLFSSLSTRIRKK